MKYLQTFDLDYATPINIDDLHFQNADPGPFDGEPWQLGLFSSPPAEVSRRRILRTLEERGCNHAHLAAWRKANRHRPINFPDLWCGYLCDNRLTFDEDGQPDSLTTIFDLEGHGDNTRAFDSVVTGIIYVHGEYDEDDVDEDDQGRVLTLTWRNDRRELRAHADLFDPQMLVVTVDRYR